MSQLSHLIKQAKNGNRINDMFKTESLVFSYEADKLNETGHTLESRLDKLESLLFGYPDATPVKSEGIIRELQSIAEIL